MHDPGLFDSMKVSHWAAGAWLRSPQLEGGVRGEREGWVDTGHESEAGEEVSVSGAELSWIETWDCFHIDAAVSWVPWP